MTARDLAAALGGREIEERDEALLEVLAQAETQGETVVEATSEQESRRLFLFRADRSNPDQFVEQANGYLIQDGLPNSREPLPFGPVLNHPPGKSWTLSVVDTTAKAA